MSTRAAGLCLASFPLLLVADFAATQAPTIQVTASTTLSVAGAATVTQPAGPLPAGGIVLDSTGPFARAMLQIDPVQSTGANSNGWSMSSLARASQFPFGLPAATTDGTIELLLTLPKPTPVRVTITGSGSATPNVLSGSWNTSVDLYADGQIDALISNFNTSGLGQRSITVGPSGTVIRIQHSTSAANTVGTNQVLTSLGLTFDRGNLAVEEFGAGCFSMDAFPVYPDDLWLYIYAPELSYTFLTIGTTQVTVPLPFTPGCLLLVDPIVTTVSFIPWTFYYTELFYPNLGPPPGQQYRIQAARLDPSGTFETSQSFVLTGL